jgi:hypothetical protein
MRWRFSELGAVLVKPSPPAVAFDVGAEYLYVLYSKLLVYHRRFDGRRDRYRPSLREWVEQAQTRGPSAERYVDAQRSRRETTAGLAGWLRDEDITALLEPTVPCVAPARSDGYDHAGSDHELISLTHYWNWTDFPVVALPGAWAAHRSAGERVADRAGRLGLAAARPRHPPAGGVRRASPLRAADAVEARRLSSERRWRDRRERRDDLGGAIAHEVGRRRFISDRVADVQAELLPPDIDDQASLENMDAFLAHVRNRPGAVVEARRNVKDEYLERSLQVGRQ